MSFISPFTGNVIQPTDVSYRTVTLAANTTLEWPINGNATDNVAARIMNVTASSGGLTLRVPPANQASVGEDLLIRNVGANTFTLADYDGNTLVSMAAGLARYVYITANTTTAGTWSVLAFGAGASAIDSSSLAGNGLKAIGATLNSAINVTTFASNYIALDTDRAENYVWTGGAGTLTLSSSATLGNDWFIVVRNGGTGTLTIATTGGDLINGSSTIALQPADSCFVTCSGAAFYTVGLGKSTQFNFTQLTKAVTTGSYTLTASEASNVIQKYTGTLSGNVTIQLPPTIQVYYITNQTDGTGSGYTITFTTGIAGTNTAVVPPGEQVILLCDSANLFNASTIAAGAVTLSLPNGTVSSPPLNFAAETTTGMYRPGSGQIGWTVLGSLRMLLNASGLGITGSGTFSGGISGGTF
jgi:hypothetical protein